MGRRFKNVNVDQLNELMNKLNERMKAGCSIDDALMYVQAYAAAEELQDIKSKGPLYNWTEIEGYKHPKSDRTIFLDRDLIAHVGYYCGKSRSWHCPDSDIHVPDDSVIAWMEYPEYREERMCHD